MSTLLKALFEQLVAQLGPALQPFLKTIVAKIVELLLKNLGGGATTTSTGGVFGLATDYTPEQMDAAITKTVEDLTK